MLRHSRYPSQPTRTIMVQVDFVPSATFPYFHSIILAIVCFTTAISITGLFSYVGFMILDFGVTTDENKAGYYAGYIGSAFMIGRLLTSVYWGQLADRIGRKPVILIGCVAVIASSVLFGISTNIYVAIFARFCLGLFNPIWGIAKTLTSELYDRKYSAIAVGLTTGCWNVGLVVGPSIGGFLSRPAKTFPHLFHPNSVLATYPYLLPNVITAALGFIGLILVYFFFPETLQTSVKVADEQDTENLLSSTVSDDPPSKTDVKHATSTSKDQQGGSITEFFADSDICNALSAYFLLSIVQIMFDELCPLWAMSSIERGGLSFNQITIGQVLGSVGIFLIFFTFIGYPILAKWLQPIRGFQVGQLLAAPFVVLVPIAVHLFRTKQTRFLTTVTLIAAVKMFNQLSVASMTLIINSMVSANKRASLNGLSIAVGSFAKSLGPILVSVGYAYSIDKSIQFHPMLFVIIAMVCVVSSVIPLKKGTSSTPAT